MRDRTKQAAAIAESTPPRRSTRPSPRPTCTHRLRSLDTDVDGLSFGRLDDEDGDTWYVGRRHVEDERGDPVVVDWRAPVSTPFYRATAADPLGLRRRRRFLMTGAPGRRPVRRGVRRPRQRRRRPPRRHPRPAARRARALPHRRDARHRRHDRGRAGRGDPGAARHLPGGAGRARAPARPRSACTGPRSSSSSTASSSTARACSSSGPTRCSCATSPRCCPSLGEAATRQTTVERLVGRPGAPRDDARAWPGSRATPAWRRCSLAAARHHLRLPERRPGGQHGLGTAADPGGRPAPRPSTRSSPATCRSPSVATRSAPGCGGWRGSATRTRGGEDAAPDRRLRRRDAHQHRRSTPPSAGSGRRCRRPVLVKRRAHQPRGAGRAPPTGCSTPTSSSACCGAPGASRLDDEPWTLAELVLVDEAEALLNGVGRTYGHVVVDEAQDLSAMELRAVARRCPSRSMTVLGDLAQATAPRRAVELGRRRRPPRLARRPRRSRSSSSATGCRSRSSTSPTACCPRSAPGVRAAAVGAPRRAAARGRAAAPSASSPAGAAAVARPGRRWSLGRGHRPATVASTRWPARSATAGVAFGDGRARRAGRRGHAARSARGQGPRVRRGRGGRAGAVVDDDERGRPAALHRPHPGGAGARHRPRRAAPGALAAPPDARGRRGGRQYASAQPASPRIGAPHRAPSLLRFASHHRRRRCRPRRGRSRPGAGRRGSSASAGRSDEARDRPRARSTSAPTSTPPTGRLLTTLQAEIDRQPVPLSEIPQHTVDAVLAVEDADFYAHDGVNLRATLRALVATSTRARPCRAAPRSPSRW